MLFLVAMWLVMWNDKNPDMCPAVLRQAWNPDLGGNAPQYPVGFLVHVADADTQRVDITLRGVYSKAQSR